MLIKRIRMIRIKIFFINKKMLLPFDGKSIFFADPKVYLLITVIKPFLIPAPLPKSMM